MLNRLDEGLLAPRSAQFTAGVPSTAAGFSFFSSTSSSHLLCRLADPSMGVSMDVLAAAEGHGRVGVTLMEGDGVETDNMKVVREKNVSSNGAETSGC